MSTLPAVVQRYAERNGLDLQRAAVLSFDARWQLLARHGDLAVLALDQLDDEALGAAFREVCIGLSRVRGTMLPQVELPAGGVADLHLVAEAECFHALLIDVRAAVELARAAQQALQELKLEQYEQRRELQAQKRKLRTARSELAAAARSQALARQFGAALRWQLLALDAELQVELGHLAAAQAAPAGSASDAAPAADARLLPLARLRASAGRLAALAAAPAGWTALSTAQPRVRGQPLAVPAGTAPLELDALVGTLAAAAAQAARERGRGFELRLERRSPLPVRLPPALLEQLLLAAIGQALLRSGRGRVEAQLRWDGGVLRLIVIDSGPAPGPAERACLWEDRLPDAGNPLQDALYALGQLLQLAGGRATLQDAAGGGVQLTASLAQPSNDGEVTAQFPVGGRVWLASADEELADEALQLLAELGFEAELHALHDSLVEAALAQPPLALLLDLRAEGAARRAFKLKARGYDGRIVALGAAAADGRVPAGFDAVLPGLDDAHALAMAIQGPER